MVKKVRDSFYHIILVLASVLAAFPLIWILLSSFKTGAEINNNPTKILPEAWTLENYIYVLKDLNFGSNLINSLIIALSTTLVTIFVSTLAAYGIIRFFPKVGKVITRLLISTYMFPTILLAIPFSVIMAALRLVNTRVGLILVYLSFSVPYAIWLLVGFFQTVPLGIEEAARIDGANKWQVFSKVVVPIITPGIVSTAIYTFINAWNEFLYGLVLINSTDKTTIAVALRALESQEIISWGQLMAASALVVLPSIVFFLIIQKKITGGLAEGSVK